MKKIINGVVVEVDDKEYMDDYEPTPKEFIIDDLKQRLADTDYKAIKYAEGLISDEDYAETKKLRQEWRDEINRLESEAQTNG